jgi:hypothetical protein
MAPYSDSVNHCWKPYRFYLAPAALVTAGHTFKVVVQKPCQTIWNAVGHHTRMDPERTDL